MPEKGKHKKANKNAAYQLICCVFLFIKAKTKFFNMNGYHQPNLSTNDSIHILKYTSCTYPIVTQFAELHVNVVCLMKAYNQCLVSFSNFVIVLINW